MKTKNLRPNEQKAKKDFITCIAKEDNVNEVTSQGPNYSLLHDSYFSLVDVDAASGLGDDFSALVAGLSNDVHLGPLKSHLESIQSEGPLPEPLTEPKRARIERKNNYSFVCKDGVKWLPQVRRNAIAEQVRFGEVAPGLHETTSSLSSQFKPLSSFEQELHQAIKESGVTDKKEDIEGVLPVAPSIKEAACTRRLAQLRALLFREHQKAKRIGKIKSRMWRKINRKSEMIERERLLAKLDEDSPELAQKIRAEMETKRAGLRLLKQQQARRKWAQVAMRFGGKEMQRVISREVQKERDEKDVLDRIVHSAPGKVLGESDSESDNTDQDVNFSSEDEKHLSDDDTNKKSTAAKVLRRAKELLHKEIDSLEPSDEKPKEEGLLGMKFMQQALERKRQESKRFADATLAEFDDLEAMVRHETDCDEEEMSDVEHSARGEESNKQSESKEYKKKDLPVIPENMLKKVKERVHSQPTTCTTTCSSSIDKRQTTPAAIPTSDVAEAMGSMLETVVHEKRFEPAVEQESLIQEAFVLSGANAEDFAAAVQEAEKEDVEEEQHEETSSRSKFLPGWGSWVGETVKAKRPIKSPSADPKPSKQSTLAGRVYINRRLDRKLAPYFVKALPYPYNTKQQFELTRIHPLGPEWNTLQVHDRLVEPQVYVRPGTVIMPLEYAKHLPENQVDSLLDAWSSQGSKKRVPKARL